MKRNRSYRRKKKERQRRRAKAIARFSYGHKDDSWANKYHESLPVCSCAMCGNPRRHLGEKTLQEQRADDSMRDQLKELQQWPRFLR